MARNKSKEEVVITRSIAMGALSIDVHMTESNIVIEALVKGPNGEVIEKLSPKQFKALQEFTEGCNGKHVCTPLVIERTWPSFPASTQPQPYWGIDTGKDCFMDNGQPQITCGTLVNNDKGIPDAVITTWTSKA